MIATGMMILLVVTISFGMISHINRMEEEKSFERLYEEVGTLADEIEMHVSNDREALEMLSSVVGKFDEMDSAELWSLLDSYTDVGMMSRIEMLLPGNTVLTKGGERVDADGTLSFEEEASRGIHVSNRETDVLDSRNYIVRHYMPIHRGGKTVAMLYGVVELGKLPDKMNLAPYSGKGALYIIDGSTGDFLIDTWHPGRAGNIWEMGEREMAPGYDSGQMKRGLIEGDSRYMVFVSRSVGKYLYFYYEPIRINEWRIAVSVPEGVVFGGTDAIKGILNIFLLFEMVCFVMYFLWMIGYVRKVTGEKQRRLDMLNYIYDVEKLLFNAHEKKENINAALEKIGEIISAGKVGFWLVGQSYDASAFLWEKTPTGIEDKEKGIKEYIYRLINYFEEGNSEFEVYDEKYCRELFPEKKWGEIHNVVAVPVEDMEGNMCGILAGCNITEGNGSASLLKNMKFSFSMFCLNLKNYMEIRDRGELDALTGLYNRNRYEREIPHIYAEHRNSLACVYIDVNGLHEINNTKGHDKGDKMLKAVAEGIRENFDTAYSYRTGGDEFVVFLADTDEAEIKSRCAKFVASLEKRDYHISVGIQNETEVSSIQELVKSAEKKMFVEKRIFYERESNNRRRRSRG